MLEKNKKKMQENSKALRRKVILKIELKYIKAAASLNVLTQAWTLLASFGGSLFKFTNY
jgi:hypothetical protein